MEKTKILLDEKEIPTHYLNLNFYLKRYLGQLPAPPLHPLTKKVLKADDLASLFPMALIEQEVATKESITISEEVRKIYRLYRPTPLFRARRLEQFLNTPARIYYKYEGVSPVGSHKPNTAIAQAFYNQKEKVKRLTTETGAGQWGSALSMACKFFSLDCLVFMVRVSYRQKPYRKILMRTFGAKVISSPSTKTRVGRIFLTKDKNTPGSLGMAISEAIEVAMLKKDTKYSLGSVLNHVLLHQTIIGLEAKKQLKKAGVYPDIIIGCVGGGSNFAGIAFPFLKDRLKKERKHLEFLAVEPKACASLTEGVYRYDHGDCAKLTPLLKMYTLGSEFVPSPIHAGGLRYHGVAPMLALLFNEGIINSVAYGQKEVFKAAVCFAQCEGIIPAPESAHAVKAVIDKAMEYKRNKEERVILFNLSGHGLLDLAAYSSFISGKLDAYETQDQAG